MEVTTPDGTYLIGYTIKAVICLYKSSNGWIVIQRDASDDASNYWYWWLGFFLTGNSTSREDRRDKLTTDELVTMAEWITLYENKED